MKWGKAIGYGIALWMTMFVIVSIFIAFRIWGSLTMQIVTAVIGGIVSFVLAGRVKPSKASLALGYGVSWAIVGLILDLLITTRFEANVFRSWTMWVGYALVVLAPVLRAVKRPTTI